VTHRGQCRQSNVQVGSDFLVEMSGNETFLSGFKKGATEMIENTRVLSEIWLGQILISKS